MPILPQEIFSVRSDKLQELRASLSYLKRLNYPIAAIARFSLVVDTNIVLGEIRWLASKRISGNAKTSLMEIVDAGTLVLYAPPALFEEVEEKIPLMAENQGINVTAMLSHWQDYKEKIRLAIPDEELVRSLRSGADPDDAEFVALERALCADGVLSKDAHISTMGGNRVSLDCIFRLRDYSRATAVELNIRVAGAHFSIVGIAGMRACFCGLKAIANVIQSAPGWLKAALLLTALLTLAQPRSRAKVLETIRGVLDSVGDAAPSVMKFVSDSAQMAHLNRAKAEEHLNRAVAELKNTQLPTQHDKCNSVHENGSEQHCPNPDSTAVDERSTRKE